MVSYGISFNVLVTASIGLITTVYITLKRRSILYGDKLPPFIKHSFGYYVSEFLKGNNHRFQLKCCRESGPIHRLPPMPWLLFPNLSIMVCDPTLARLILEGDKNNRECEKSDRYKRMQAITAGQPTMGIKSTFGEEGWECSRKAVAPSFSNTNLYKVLPELSKCLNQFNDIIDSHILQDKSLDNIVVWMVALTMDFLAKSMFNCEFNTLHHHAVQNETAVKGSEGYEFVTKVDNVIRETMLRQTLNPFRKYQFWNKEISIAKTHAVDVQNISQRVLDKYRREHTAEQTEIDSSIIGHLVKSPYPSDKERVADVTAFMVAGHETTANQTSWLIIELSRHPLVVARIRAELDALFPAGTAVDFTPQTLSQLHYLTMVIKEGMRLWAVAPIGSSRVVSKDIHYKEFIIPKGANIGIGQFSILRSGIDRPDEFIPERWAEKNVDAAVLREMNVPFSAGKRGCVGQNLALLQLKLVLSSLFYSYDFELISEVTEFFFLSLKPLNANFKVTRRVM